MKIYLSKPRSELPNSKWIAWKMLFWRSREKKHEWLRDGKSDLLLELVSKVISPFCWLKNRINRLLQVTYVKVDYWDIWNADHTMSLMILPVLKMLKEDKTGYASGINESDAPEHLKDDKDRWDWIMDEMIFAFESKQFDWEQQFRSGEIDLRYVDIDDETVEIKRGPNDTYEVDWEGRSVYQARISNGFRLFGVYYEALWD